MSDPLYTARHGLIWAFASQNVRTVREAEEALPVLLQMAVSERDDDLSEDWIARIGDLVRAVREAKTQDRAEPVARAA